MTELHACKTSCCIQTHTRVAKLNRVELVSGRQWWGVCWHTIACPWQKMATLDSVWVSKKHLLLNLVLIQAVAFTVGLVSLSVGWVSSVTGTLWSSVTTIMPVCVQRGASGCPSSILRQVSPRATATSGWRNGIEDQVGHTHSQWSVLQQCFPTSVPWHTSMPWQVVRCAVENYQKLSLFRYYYFKSVLLVIVMSVCGFTNI